MIPAADLAAAREGAVRLHPVGADDVALRAALVALEPAPEQLRFSASARQTLPAADADPRRVPFAVLAGDLPVGFGALDRGEHLRELVDDPPRAVLLRGFYLDASAQGRGWGTAAARAVPALARRLWGPEASGGPALVVLTVNTANPVAVRAYTAAGFADTGAQYLGGDHGPQHVLVAAVPPAPAPAAARP